MTVKDASNRQKDSETISRISQVVIFSFAIILVVALVSFFSGIDVITSFEGVVSNLLRLIIYTLHFLAGALILIGSILLATRYLKAKVKAPLQPIEFMPRARYLTVGLELLIGAEVVHTALTRSLEEFLLLILVIATRSFIALLIHLEKKWGMHQ